MQLSTKMWFPLPFEGLKYMSELISHLIRFVYVRYRFQKILSFCLQHPKVQKYLHFLSICRIYEFGEFYGCWKKKDLFLKYALFTCVFTWFNSMYSEFFLEDIHNFPKCILSHFSRNLNFLPKWVYVFRNRGCPPNKLLNTQTWAILYKLSCIVYLWFKLILNQYFQMEFDSGKGIDNVIQRAILQDEVQQTHQKKASTSISEI